MNASASLSRDLIALAVYAAVAGLFAILTDGVLRDDAYIFFQYARETAHTGVLSFQYGEPSYGVTSILWTLLLTGAAVLSDHMVIWGKLFGLLFGSIGCVLWVRFIAERLGMRLSLFAVALAALAPGIGAERMVTGMETGLVCMLSGAFLLAVTRQYRGAGWWAGLLGGLLILTRLELGIAVVVALALLLARQQVVSAVKVAVGTVAVSLWWPLYLYVKTGHVLPPTRAGKLSVFLPEHLGVTIDQFEAASLGERLRIAFAAAMEFATAASSHLVLLLLLAAAVLFVILAARRLKGASTAALLIPPAWFLFMVALYAWAFPLLKIRYFVWLVPGLAAVTVYAARISLPKRLMRFGEAAVLAGLLILLVPGLQNRIESTREQQLRREVAATAAMVTPPAARIALEPIGEFGYYADRYIIDMGGLVSSSTAPYIRGGYADTARIWQCLVDHEADYLVTYTGDGFLGRLPRAYPERFQTVAWVPSDTTARIGYRIIKILR
jgi:hypothetical protein